MSIFIRELGRSSEGRGVQRCASRANIKKGRSQVSLRSVGCSASLSNEVLVLASQSLLKLLRSRRRKRVLPIGKTSLTIPFCFFNPLPRDFEGAD
jgi:hypothetical protein